MSKYREYLLLPNLLTVLRIPLAFAFVILYVCLGNRFVIWHLVIGIVIEMTDALDGYVARRLKQDSNLGKILDPMADSYSRMMLLVCLTVGGYFPLIGLMIVMFRDTLVPFVRQRMAFLGVSMSARFSGKLKAVVQAIYINCTVGFHVLLCGTGYAALAKSFGFWGGMVMIMVTAWSGFDYFMALMREPENQDRRP